MTKFHELYMRKYHVCTFLLFNIRQTFLADVIRFFLFSVKRKFKINNKPKPVQPFDPDREKEQINNEFI